MWGSGTWGQMIWGGPGEAVPLLAPGGLLLLVVLMIASTSIALRRGHSTLSISLFVLALLVPIAGYAASVAVPNVFTNGTIADADEVNANFDAVAVAINDNDTKVDAVSALFGANTSFANAGSGGECTLADVWLTAGAVSSGVPAQGQLLLIANYNALFSLMGTIYGGDGQSTFALPDLRDAAPSGLTYVICMQGIYPSQS